MARLAIYSLEVWGGGGAKTATRDAERRGPGARKVYTMKLVSKKQQNGKQRNGQGNEFFFIFPGYDDYVHYIEYHGQNVLNK